MKTFFIRYQVLNKEFYKQLGNWQPSSKNPLTRISRTRHLNFNHLDGIRRVEDIDEENGINLPVELAEIARKVCSVYLRNGEGNNKI